MQNNLINYVIKWIMMMMMFKGRVRVTTQIWSYSKTQIVPMLWILIGVLLPCVAGYCTRDSDCTSPGEVCRLYNGCPSNRGTCTCNTQTHVQLVENRQYVCKKLVRAGDFCTSRDICGAGMLCREGMCQCNSGVTTDDMLLCHSSHTRLLRDTCRFGMDQCYQKSAEGPGYTPNGVQCSNSGQCRCKDGFKEDGIRCRRFLLGEEGCSEHYQCQSDAFCLSNQCSCRTGYRPTSDGKCVKYGAITNIPLGKYCDEANNSRYCGRGLMCYTCQSNANSVCVSASPNEGSLLSSSSSNSLSTVLLISAIVQSIVTRLLTSHHFHTHAQER